MTHTELQAAESVTAAAASTGVAINAITGDWTLVLEILNQGGGAVGNSDCSTRFVFEDSADNFSSDILAGPSAMVLGTIGDGQGTLASSGGFSPDTKRFTFTKKDFPDMRFGVASAKVRIHLTRISGSVGTPTVAFHAWLEY